MEDLNQSQLAQIEQSISVEQIQLSEKVGALKATAFFKKLVTVTEIKVLAEIKESKQYKGLRIVQDGKFVTVTNWAQFCQHLGLSCEKVDLDIQNLSTFGEDFLETSQRMGLGYRDLRKLRKLPESDREILINGESVKTEDRESLIDLIEELTVKHAKEKEALTTRVADLEASDAAKDQIVKAKNEKITDLDVELTKLKSPVQVKKRIESEPQQLEQAALETLSTESILFLTAFNRYINAIGSVLDLASEKELPQLYDRVDESVVATCQRYAHFVRSMSVQVDFEDWVTPAFLFPEAVDTQPTEVE